MFNSNQKFIGQGRSNTAGGLFQCYAGSGSFTRSHLNEKSGAKTPTSAILAALFLFGLLFLLAAFVD
ncbi:MAG: SulP family inorganic anion transporter [Rhodobacteraceae bacterium]|nr:SulP family inorganic anion transporter [Paracoccaceae bacterium]